MTVELKFRYQLLSKFETTSLQFLDKLSIHLIKRHFGKQPYSGLIELLTPVIKSYCSDQGQEVCRLAIQIYGGYGYTKEYPVEQLYRDCKITSIYEGTNGIQAMDLLGRKVGMRKGAVFMDFLQEIEQTIQSAGEIPALGNMATAVEHARARLSEVAIHLGRTAISPQLKVAFAHAHPFLDVMYDVVMAWMHLWRATVALPKLEKLAAGSDVATVKQKVAKNKDAAFYDGQLKSAEFFIHTILPTTLGKMNAILAGNPAAVEIDERSFGG
jgi:hypothetical protein